MKITWKAEQSDVIHSIPEKAIVTFSGSNGEFQVWLDNEGNIHYFDVGESIIPPPTKD